MSFNHANLTWEHTAGDPEFTLYSASAWLEVHWHDAKSLAMEELPLNAYLTASERDGHNRAVEVAHSRLLQEVDVLPFADLFEAFWPDSDADLA